MMTRAIVDLLTHDHLPRVSGQSYQYYELDINSPVGNVQTCISNAIQNSKKEAGFMKTAKK
jgi:hypothetical protein